MRAAGGGGRQVMTICSWCTSETKTWVWFYCASTSDHSNLFRLHQVFSLSLMHAFVKCSRRHPETTSAWLFAITSCMSSISSMERSTISRRPASPSLHLKWLSSTKSTFTGIVAYIDYKNYWYFKIVYFRQKQFGLSSSVSLLLPESCVLLLSIKWKWHFSVLHSKCDHLYALKVELLLYYCIHFTTRVLKLSWKKNALFYILNINIC